MFAFLFHPLLLHGSSSGRFLKIIFYFQILCTHIQRLTLFNEDTKTLTLTSKENFGLVAEHSTYFILSFTEVGIFVLAGLWSLDGKFAAG
jgi:hypothetical protein